VIRIVHLLRKSWYQTEVRPSVPPLLFQKCTTLGVVFWKRNCTNQDCGLPLVYQHARAKTIPWPRRHSGPWLLLSTGPRGVRAGVPGACVRSSSLPFPFYTPPTRDSAGPLRQRQWAVPARGPSPGASPLPAHSSSLPVDPLIGFPRFGSCRSLIHTSSSIPVPRFAPRYRSRPRYRAGAQYRPRRQERRP